MLWLALDLAVALIPLVLLGLAGMRLWRAVKGLTRTAGEAGDTVGAATDRLAAAQAAGPQRR